MLPVDPSTATPRIPVGGWLAAAAGRSRSAGTGAENGGDGVEAMGETITGRGGGIGES